MDHPVDIGYLVIRNMVKSVYMYGVILSWPKLSLCILILLGCRVNRFVWSIST